MRWLPPAVIMLIACAAALGDIVHLKDGSSIEGNLRKSDSGWTITKPDGSTVQVSATQVQSVEIQRSSHGADQAESGLISLRRAVDHLDNLDEIITRYDRFIKNNPDTPAAAQARQDLAQWQSRRDQSMVKYGKKWVTPAERQTLAVESLEQVSRARQLIKQGKLKEAAGQLNDIVKANPDNSAALYLRGVLSYRQDQIVPARNDFLAVNELTPDHAPTLNNLGVILWRQRQPVGAVKYYNLAMESDPLNKTVLDNTAEALHALNANDQQSVVAIQAARRFKEQDAELSQKMLPQGWHRWGATWVDDKQYQQLKEVEKQVQQQLDALAAQYQDIQNAISRIDEQIATNNRSLQSIAAQTYLPDPNGNWVYVGLPSVYYDIQAANRKLLSERAQKVSQLEQIRQSGHRIEKQLPIPKYPGIQRLIGVEGTPLGAADIPSTSPSTTQPSP